MSRDLLELDTMSFFASVSNLGTKAMSNVGLRARVFDPAGELVFEDSLIIDELPAGYQDSLLFFRALLCFLQNNAIMFLSYSVNCIV